MLVIGIHGCFSFILARAKVMDQGQGPSGRRQAATYAPPPHLREKVCDRP